MTTYEELKARGLIAQVTDEEKVKELVDAGKAVFYIGFDPTAACRAFHGALPDETAADGGKPADRADWRWNRDDRRSIWTYRYAQHDDQRNNSS